jgi:hypothetical protein
VRRCKKIGIHDGIRCPLGSACKGRRKYDIVSSDAFFLLKSVKDDEALLTWGTFSGKPCRATKET